MDETPGVHEGGTVPTKADSAPPAVSELAYRSLYRRFRPQRFADVRGQDHVTTALRNAVRDERITHAYLFSGPRGTGKTSTARILAMALNCAAPEEGEPCTSCDSCRSIAAGTSFDVHELDAASNNGVDAMRDLVARTALATPGRWKVYIVDEVHMLSTAASNALLKTLEEPPDNVVFVLATTDPQKVLPTIRSRTQHYEFHLIGEDVLGTLLADVAGQADLELPDGALAAALRQGRGSARDALSALDQVAASGVLPDDAGATRAILAGVVARDVAAALAALDAALASGRDVQQLAVELVARLRSGFLFVVAPRLEGHNELALDAVEVDQARELGTARAVRAMETLGTALVAMRDAPDPRVSLEVALVRLTHLEADDSPAGIAERLERIEARLNATEGASPPPPPRTVPLDAPEKRPPATGQPSAAPPPAAPRATSGADPATAPEPTAGAAASPPGPRPALGAYRERAVASAQAAPRPTATRPTASRPPAHPPTTPPSPAAEVARAEVGPAASTRPAPEEPAASEATAPVLSSPSRDELVAAWGDAILVALRAKVRAIYQVGRFVAGGEAGAVLALPNEAHLSHAAPLLSEVTNALASHFKRPVPVRLVVEGSEAPATSSPPRSERSSLGAAEPVATASGEDEEDLHEVDPGEGEPVAEPAGGLTWVEDRLRKAFPGAEEV